MWTFDHSKIEKHLKSLDIPVQDFYNRIWMSDTQVYSLKNGHAQLTKIISLLDICNEFDLDPRDFFVK